MGSQMKWIPCSLLRWGFLLALIAESFLFCDPASYGGELVLTSNTCHYTFAYCNRDSSIYNCLLWNLLNLGKSIDRCTWRYKESYSPWDFKGPKLLQRSSGPALCEGTDERDYHITIMYVFRPSLHLLQCNVRDAIIWAIGRWVTSFLPVTVKE